MKVTLVGTGYVGLVTAACLADVGHDVLCLQPDPEAVALLNAGVLPMHEPGLSELVAQCLAAGRLAFSCDALATVSHGEVQIVAVGTPPGAEGGADLTDVIDAVRTIGRLAVSDRLVVLKSTVPVGTAEQVADLLACELALRELAQPPSLGVAVNPEFLREGTALDNFRRPDRVLVGTSDTPEGSAANASLAQLYAPFIDSPGQVIRMDLRSAEFAKYAANAMLATRISFMNELPMLAAHGLAWVGVGRRA